MTRLLVVKDHAPLRESLMRSLANEGFTVESASSLSEARTSLENAPDLVILDWMLPDGQGIDLLSDLRRRGSRIPAIVLTARAETIDKVLGLELGASDYVTKPFDSRELIARIRTRLREKSMATEAPEIVSSHLNIGSLTIDRQRFKVTFQGKNVDLVKKEFDLLVMFAESPEKVFSRDEILNKVWGYDVFPTTRTVDTHVMWLRQKLSSELIETVRAVGYRFKPL